LTTSPEGLKALLPGSHDILSAKPLSGRQKRRSKEAPMPAASAGLLRFFEGETKGIRVRPEAVVILSAALVFLVIFARMGFRL